MPRPRVHETDAMLDATRDLLLEDGARAATVEAIAAASGAPTGSIYHRFGSRDQLIARLWMRAVNRSQASALAAMEQPDPKRAAVGAALSILDFCEEHPADAQLLVSFRREDLIAMLPPGPLSEELRKLNRPVQRAIVDLARRLYGKRTRAALERTMLVVFDFPYGAARRHLISGRKFPPGLRSAVERAVSVIIDEPLSR